MPSMVWVVARLAVIGTAGIAVALASVARTACVMMTRILWTAVTGASIAGRITVTTVLTAIIVTTKIVVATM